MELFESGLDCAKMELASLDWIEMEFTRCDWEKVEFSSLEWMDNVYQTRNRPDWTGQDFLCDVPTC